MLQNDGNAWRGMLVGMTRRSASPRGSDARPLWRLWDNFGIEQAERTSWWVRDAPAQTGRDEVLASSYVRHDKTLIVLTSWAPQATTLKRQIDRKALGLKPDKATVKAPVMAGFQPAAAFKPGDAIPVDPGEGCLQILE